MPFRKRQEKRALTLFWSDRWGATKARVEHDTLCSRNTPFRSVEQPSFPSPHNGNEGWTLYHRHTTSTRSRANNKTRLRHTRLWRENLTYSTIATWCPASPTHLATELAFRPGCAIRRNRRAPRLIADSCAPATGTAAAAAPGFCWRWFSGGWLLLVRRGI